MSVEEIKKKLKEYKQEDIILTQHTEIRAFQRNIAKEMIISQLLNPENLIDAIEQESKHQNEDKYKMVFKLSNNRNFVIVASFNKAINVVTVLIMYRKWVRPVAL